MNWRRFLSFLLICVFAIITFTAETCGDPEDDRDYDGYSEVEGDCNDNDATIYPGATETCNLVDDNCDGTVDEGVGTYFYPDNDGDGYGKDNSGVETGCSAPEGYADNEDDCDDTKASVYPGAHEYENGIDDDCDGLIDEDYVDNDGDGYTEFYGDCDDANPKVYPRANASKS